MHDFKWPTTKTKVHVSVVLDRSGSMVTCKTDTIEGFNSYIRGLRDNKEIDYYVSLTQFDDLYEVNYVRKPLAEVEYLNDETYVPRGWTSLLDAVGKTINVIGTVAPDEKLLMIIITDGHENTSKEFKHDQIKTLITERDKLDNWSFVYMGAVADAWNQGSALGINVGNIAKYSLANSGFAFSATASGSNCFALSREMKTKVFYSMDNTFTDLSNG
jgi:hypothetical protein